MGLKFNNNNNLYEEIIRRTISEGENEYYISEYPDFLVNNSVKIKSKNLGEKFASINSFFFEYLKGFNIPCAFVGTIGPNCIKFLKNEKFPFSIKILNAIDKRNSKILGLKESSQLNLPFFEIHYGNGKESIITESHLISLDLCSVDELKAMNRLSSKINAILKSFFERRNYILSEVTCSFGKSDDKLFIIDDFTPKSLKVASVDPESKTPDPYKFGTSTEIKQYTEHLLNLMST